MGAKRDMSSKKKERIEIPDELADRVLFYSDRTCCVCREKNRPIQIHHIDDDPSNNSFINLAVLCFDCHHKTQITGGFDRKLNARQVTMFRDEWLTIVSKRWGMNYQPSRKFASPQSAIEVEVATTVAEIYREREEYILLAIHYITIGNDELRDKYIELVIQRGIDDETLIAFRKAQGHLDLVPSEIKERYIKELKGNAQWIDLGQFYHDLGEDGLAVKFMCYDIIEKIDSGNIYSAALVFKEMVKLQLLESLLFAALTEARVNNNLWKQLRILLELNQHSEAIKFLLKHKEEIESSHNVLLSYFLTTVLGDERRKVEARKNLARAFREVQIIGNNTVMKDGKIVEIEKGSFFNL